MTVIQIFVLQFDLLQQFRGYCNTFRMLHQRENLVVIITVSIYFENLVVIITVSIYTHISRTRTLPLWFVDWIYLS
jgi:hypothetical protein